MDYYITMESKLFDLQKACRRYTETDPLAMWVSYAMERYIMSNKATISFERAFLAYPDSDFEQMIRKCMNGDKSDLGIIATCKRILQKYML